MGAILNKQKKTNQKRISLHPILDTDDKDEFIDFTFNKKPLKAKKGEMISSALFANNIHIFGRHKKDNSPQGMFCANGQCSQCLVIADGLPVKSCINPVKKGMNVKSLEGLPELIDDDKLLKKPGKIPRIKTDVLIIGGGPAGLSAGIELGKKNVKCIICDDKQELGGKLTLQTHNFFGSIKECYAGTRGMDIGKILAKDVKNQKSVKVWLDSPVVGIFVEGLVGVVKNGTYLLVKPNVILVTAGAREKTLAFPGCDLPGIYGAGAFQTLVNRDLVKPTDKLFIVGGGNVGLIAAYHALQAGIDVIGLVEALSECGGYKVHLDKIKRLGVPVFTSHTVLRAEGKNHLEKVIIAKIDKNFKPIKGAEAEFEADTLLIAVGLNPVDELKAQAENFGLKVYAAGDANEIAEASAAMISGRITARKILKDMGYKVSIPSKWKSMVKILSSRPGPVKKLYPIPKDKDVYPVIRCIQEIPCNPCIQVCPKDSIKINDNGLMGRPKFVGECIACGKCIAICPGLAITIVDKRYDKTKKKAKVIIPWEMPKGTIKIGETVTTTGLNGEVIGKAKVLKLQEAAWQNKRILTHLEVPFADADKVAGVAIKTPSKKKKVKSVKKPKDEEIIVCRCERVTKKEIIDYIKKTGTRDVNAVKAALRVGMGPCGGKTCTQHIMRIFAELGIKPDEVEPHVERPFTQEVQLDKFLGKKEEK